MYVVQDSILFRSIWRRSRNVIDIRCAVSFYNVVFLQCCVCRSDGWTNGYRIRGPARKSSHVFVKSLARALRVSRLSMTEHVVLVAYLAKWHTAGYQRVQRLQSGRVRKKVCANILTCVKVIIYWYANPSNHFSLRNNIFRRIHSQHILRKANFSVSCVK